MLQVIVIAKNSFANNDLDFASLFLLPAIQKHTNTDVSINSHVNCQ